MKATLILFSVVLSSAVASECGLKFWHCWNEGEIRCECNGGHLVSPNYPCFRSLAKDNISSIRELAILSPRQVRCGDIAQDWGICTFNRRMSRGTLVLGALNDITDIGNREGVVADQKLPQVWG